MRRCPKWCLRFCVHCRATPNLHTLVPVTGYSSYRLSTFVLIEARDEWQFLKEFDVSLAEDTVEVIVDRDATREGVRLRYEIEVGALVGAGLTVLVTQPGVMSVGLSAMAAAPDTYQELSLFGDVFDRVRADYVDKPDDHKLIE